MDALSAVADDAGILGEPPPLNPVPRRGSAKLALFLFSPPPAKPTPVDESVAPVSRPAVVRASPPAHEDFRSTLFLIRPRLHSSQRAENSMEETTSVMARLQSLVKNSSDILDLKGHDFNRAARSIKSKSGFSPRGMFSRILPRCLTFSPSCSVVPIRPIK